MAHRSRNDGVRPRKGEGGGALEGSDDGFRAGVGEKIDRGLAPATGAVVDSFDADGVNGVPESGRRAPSSRPAASRSSLETGLACT